MDRDHRDQREIGVAEPVVAAEAERARDHVHEADIGRQHERAPEEAHDDRREHDRQDRGDTQQRLSARNPQHEQRERQAERDLQRDGRRGVDGGERERMPEARVAAHLHVIVEPREPGEPGHRELDAHRARPREVDERRRCRQDQREERGQEEREREPSRRHVT